VEPRPIDPPSDMPAVAALLGRTYTTGGIFHPGGIQWWLRDLAAEREDFAAFIWAGADRDADRDVTAFVMFDGNYVIAESIDQGPPRTELIDWATRRLRSAGATEIETSAVEGSALHESLTSGGFKQSGSGFELVVDTASHMKPPLAEGFRFASLLDVDDDRFIEGHRAAWSDARPSPYRPALHDVVTAMPQFRRDFVTIVLAPDDAVASYCIGWLDPVSATLEIEPLGTHRDYRRLGLARAVVHEVTGRAAQHGARHVLVWNNPETNPKAYGLYTSAGMAPRRTVVELRRKL
jgi:GNAT superfamily N-acetyltransferase